jgi:hypothetical protein
MMVGLFAGPMMEQAVRNNAQIQLLDFCISFMPLCSAGQMPPFKNLRNTPKWGRNRCVRLACEG